MLFGAYHYLLYCRRGYPPSQVCVSPTWLTILQADYTLTAHEWLEVSSPASKEDLDTKLQTNHLNFGVLKIWIYWLKNLEWLPKFCCQVP